ncbi:TRAP C4-dicarboxylate transporter [Cohnella kolymensis]|uniref:TRAP C4-dicarboxylate transporter n=1 Tax=Cohnella kolymensis TaxID=1590652 RepID=A0ABR5A8N7_9BACL|nr:TRAP transporter small permease [Cohnella kolymensis]KIL37367.1 TRAP C4-dicarboxylate transporter [Cohnella kolymensis]
MNLVAKLSDAVFRIEKVIVSIAVLIMSLSLIAGVIFRYFFNSPLVWSDEIAMYSFIWISFVGGSMALKKDQLASVSILMDRLNGKIRMILLSVGFAIVLGFLIYFLVYSIPWILSPDISFQQSTAMMLPMIYPYLSVPVGIAGMTIHALDLFLKSLTTREKA